MRITVCVATKNRTDMLHQLLWSLIRQEYADWDLVIVDDSDKPVQWNDLGVYPRLFNEMTRSGHDVRIAPGPRVSRIGAAYQTGFKVSRPENPLFFRVDDDSWLEPDYLVKLAAIMKDEMVGACGGLFLHPGKDIETFAHDDPRYIHSTIENLSDFVNIQWFRHEICRPIPVEHLTANILFSREWLERIGGFETQLYQQHRDETQATLRLWIEGAKLLVHPGAVAWHLRGVNGGARGHGPDIYLNDHRTFMAQRKTMKPGIHIHLGHGIGDTFMAIPMLKMMRGMNPDRDISVCGPHAMAALQGNPDIDELTDQPLGAQRTVRFQQSVYEWASANDWKGHLAQAYCKMLNLPEPNDLIPKMGGNREKSNGALLDRQYMVIAPWSNAKTFDLFKVSGNKNWPMDRWPHVVDWAHANGFRVVQLRGSVEEPLVEGIDVDVCGAPLEEAMGWIYGASLIVSVDTMAHHAAASAGVPAVVLWGRSRAEHFGYTQPNIVNIQGECPGGLPTAPPGFGNPECLSRIDRPCISGNQWSMDMSVCPIEGHPCMESISVEQVINACESLVRGGFVNVQ